MNWSDDLKTIWLTPTRTGTRSMREVLSKMGFKSSLGGTFPDHGLFFPKSMCDYQVICNVRNPYSRIVSLYFLTLINSGQRIDFEYFVKNIVEILHNRFNIVIYKNLETNIKFPDKIIKLENFSEDILSLDLIKTKYDILKDSLEKYIFTNTFSDEHISLKQNFVGWKEMYNEKLAEIVYNLTEKDFINFGYEKNSWK